jgi:hypothetical protein
MIFNKVTALSLFVLAGSINASGQHDARFPGGSDGDIDAGSSNRRALRSGKKKGKSGGRKGSSAYVSKFVSP